MSYHHGDLARAALEAAYAHLREHPHDDFSVRQIADALEVTPRAIYRHYGDKRGLLIAVVARAFSDLGDRLDALASPEGDDRRLALMAVYLRFALASPPRYRLMFSLGVGALQAQPEVWRHVERLIRHCDEAFARAHPQLAPQARRDWIVAIWGLAHGLLDLYLNGSLRAASADQAEAYVRDQLAHALRHPPA